MTNARRSRSGSPRSRSGSGRITPKGTRPTGATARHGADARHDPVHGQPVTALRAPTRDPRSGPPAHVRRTGVRGGR